jgi:hypothetical protein
MVVASEENDRGVRIGEEWKRTFYAISDKRFSE